MRNAEVERQARTPHLPSFSIPHSSFSIILMRDLDFFDFFRWALAIVATIYATVITLQSLWGWYVWLAGSDKYMTMLRRYVIVHGLRLRFRAFWGDVIICLLLCVAFLILWHAHTRIYQLQATMESLPSAQPSAQNQHVSRIAQQH
jgi:hypothetical protein